MEILLIFTGAFAVALSGALIPGPMLTVTVMHSLRSGFRAGPLMTAGHAVAELGLLALIVMGLGPILTRPAVMRGIYIGGGVLLLLTGVYIFRARNHSPAFKENSDAPSSSGPLLSGLLVSISNPTWTLWWATIGLAYVTRALGHGVMGLAAFFSGHILADLGWYAFVSFSVSRGGRLISPSVYRKFMTACSVAVALFGIWFLVSGLGTPPAPL